MSQLDLSGVLANCVSDLRAGRRTVDDCLAAYPELSGELEPLLRLAQRVRPLPEVRPDPVRKMRARYRFVEALHEERHKVEWRHGLVPVAYPFERVRRERLKALPGMIVAVLAIVLTMSGGVTLAAQNARPGDSLYGVRAVIEQFQAATAYSDGTRAEVQLRVAERRLDELSRALDAGDAGAAAKASEGYQAAVASAAAHLARVEASGDDASQARARLEALRSKHASLADTQARTSRQAPASSVAPVGRAPVGSLESKIGELEDIVLSLAGGVSDASGQSYLGLHTRLQAAEAAARRGQTTAALGELSAFRSQLDAEYRSGRLTRDAYDDLVARYDASLASLGLAPTGASSTPTSPAERGSGAGGAGQDKR